MTYCALIGLIQKCFPGAACIAVFCLKIEHSNLLQLITNGKNFLILNFVGKIDALTMSVCRGKVFPASVSLSRCWLLHHKFFRMASA